MLKKIFLRVTGLSELVSETEYRLKKLNEEIQKRRPDEMQESIESLATQVRNFELTLKHHIHQRSDSKWPKKFTGVSALKT